MRAALFVSKPEAHGTHGTNETNTTNRTQTSQKSHALPVLTPPLAVLTQNLWRSYDLGGKLCRSQPEHLPKLVAVMITDNPAFVSITTADTSSALCLTFFGQ